MKTLFSIVACFITLQTTRAQVISIKIKKDTVFNVADFINFNDTSGTNGLSFIKDKYFKTSPTLTGVQRYNCTDQADNPPYTIINANFTIHFCVWAKGDVSSKLIIFNNKKYLDEEIVTVQLKGMNYLPGNQEKEKKGIIRKTYCREVDKKKKLYRCIILRIKKHKVIAIDCDSWDDYSRMKFK